MQIIYSSSKSGPKYEKVYKSLKIENEYISHKELLKKLFSFKANPRINYYHLRYLILNGWSKYIFYFILPPLLTLNKIKLVWTIHNVVDHHSKFTLINRVLNYYLIASSYKCIVMHTDIKNTFPKILKKKIYVSNFGPMSLNEVARRNKKDNCNIEKVKIFLDDRKKELVLFSISTAKHNNSYILSRYLTNNSLMIFIDPDGSFNNKLLLGPNLLYINDIVGVDFLNYIKSLKYPVGLVGHTNMSVATSLFMFGTMGLPILGLDYSPNNSIIEKYKIGEVLKNVRHLNIVTKQFKLNYLTYQENLFNFLKDNNWDQSFKKHSKIFK